MASASVLESASKLAIIMFDFVDIERRRFDSINEMHQSKRENKEKKLIANMN
jgi:hypothetical protein